MALTHLLFPLALLSLLVFASANNYDYHSTVQNPNVDSKKSPVLGQDHHETQDNYLRSTLKGLNLDVLNSNQKDYELQKRQGQVNFVPTKPGYEKPELEGQEYTVPREQISYKRPKSEGQQYKVHINPTSYKKPEPEGHDYSVLAKPISYKKSKPEGQEYTIPTKPTSYTRPKSGDQGYSVPTKPISYKKSEPEGQKHTVPPPARY